MPMPQQFAYRLDVPLAPDSVDSPIVRYGDPLTALHFPLSEPGWGRVTFERLDSLRVSRGEYSPYPAAPAAADEWSWVDTISNSAWLRERYEYEKQHYGTSYRFNGDVEEMLQEYDHYVFSFHDEYVEALAAGIWFEAADEMLGDSDLSPDHPLRGLADHEPTERFEHAGLLCEVRSNSLPLPELARRAQLCSQTLFEFRSILDGYASPHPHWCVTLRQRHGTTRSYVRGYFDNAVAQFDRIATLADARPHVEQWLSKVSQRRRERGLDS